MPLPPRPGLRVDPSVGGNGYPTWFHRRVLDEVQSGFHGSQNANIEWAAAQHRVHPVTIYRWLTAHAVTGTCERADIGLGGREGVLTDYMTVVLLIYITAYPDCFNDEAINYLCSICPALTGVVKTWHISRTTNKFKMTFKKLRKNARERNAVDRAAYWSTPLPNGINGVHTTRFVDTDESGIFITSGNRNHGRAFIGQVFTLPCAVDMGAGPDGRDRTVWCDC